MLTVEELRRWVDHFAVPESAIKRDHLVSHVIAQLPAVTPDAVFFGGTALCRTHLEDWRLSEDIDLLVEERGPVRQSIDERLGESVRREYPGLQLRWVREDDTTVGLVEADGLAIRMQLVASDASYRRYPIGVTPVGLRYSDLPPSVDLLTPTVAAATAMKLNAWTDRAAPRDLCDLYGLALRAAITPEAIAIAADVSREVQLRHFEDDRAPHRDVWLTAIGHQMAEPPDPQVAIAEVRTAVLTAIRSAEPGPDWPIHRSGSAP